MTNNLGTGLIVNQNSVVMVGGPPPGQFTIVSDNGASGIGTDAAVLTINGGLPVEENTDPAIMKP